MTPTSEHPPSAHPWPEKIETYEDALDFLDQLDVSALKLGLSRIEKLMASLDDPQERLPMIHIAGTNGKGSVAAMLTAVLTRAGYTVGTFTSPHLVDVRERIALNGKPISREDFLEETAFLAHHLESLDWDSEDWPTYFEFLNALAYQYFYRKQADITIFEVGLGGRLDSTNLIQQPLATVITSIGMDHMERLGHTLAEIAGEKAGIAKPGTPLILGPDIPREALEVIYRQAERQQAEPVLLTQASRVSPAGRHNLQSGSLQSSTLHSNAMQRLRDTVSGQILEIPLLGTYQRNNLATVLETLSLLKREGMNIPEEAIAQGLRMTQWSARFQVFPKLRMIVDGSHNADGFQSLSESLSLYFGDRPFYWLLSLRKNRTPDQLMRLIQKFPNTQGIVWTCPSEISIAKKPDQPPRSLYHSPKEMAEYSRTALPETLACDYADSVFGALEKLQQQLAQSDQAWAIVTGSLYTAGEVITEISQVLEGPSP